MVTVSALAATLFLGGYRARGRSRSGTAPTPAGGRAVVPAQGRRRAVRLHLAARARCPGCATTSSCASGGRCWCPPRWCGSSPSPPCAPSRARRTCPAGRWPLRRAADRRVVLAVLLVASRKSNAPTRIAALTPPRARPTPRARGAAPVRASGARHRPAQRSGPARAEGGFPIPPMDLVVPPSPGWPARSRSPPAPRWRRSPSPHPARPEGRRCLTPARTRAPATGGEVEQAGGRAPRPRPAPAGCPPRPGFGVTFSTMFKKVTHRAVPRRPR